MWDEQRDSYTHADQRVTDVTTQRDSCSANLQTATAKVDLLGKQISAQQTQISGQQALIAGQLATSGKQQSTFNLCVTTLASTNAPVPQITTVSMATIPVSTAPRKHTSIMVVTTNKQQTPARLVVGCDEQIDVLTVLPLGGGPPFQGAVAPLQKNVLAGLTTSMWVIQVTQPEWTPTQPLLLRLDYDADNLEQCFAR
jgi:hypothetical protein